MTHLVVRIGQHQSVLGDGFIGYEKGRLAGLLIAGACFIIPAALLVALMKNEFVTRRRWLTREQFLDRLVAANLLLGPSSTIRASSFSTA